MKNDEDTIDQFLAEVREHLEGQLNEARTAVDGVRAAVDRYLHARASDLVAAASVRLGLGGDRPEAAGAAARDLLALVGALARSTEIPASPPTLPSATEQGFAASASVDTTSAARALYREFRAEDWDAMPNDEFRWAAEQYAARARALQAAGLATELDETGRIIRELTARRGDRNVSNVFGLSRSHNGDWASLAQRAATQRALARSSAPRPLTHKLPLGPAIAETQSVERDDVDAQVDDCRPATAALPMLSARLRDRPLIVVGGVAVPEKVERLRRMLDCAVEWVETDGDRIRDIGRVADRVLADRIGAVVVLQALGGHRHFDPIIDAARAVSTPFALGGTAGTGALREALREIEDHLAKRSMKVHSAEEGGAGR